MHHLLDPRTGCPAATDLVAVTVVGPSTMWAEIHAKVVRAVPMLSLDNTYSDDDLREFCDRARRGLVAAGISEPPVYVLEPKIDGIGIELR